MKKDITLVREVIYKDKTSLYDKYEEKSMLLGVLIFCQLVWGIMFFAGESLGSPTIDFFFINTPTIAVLIGIIILSLIKYYENREIVWREKK